MSDNQLEQELREIVEQEINQRLEHESNQLQEYQSNPGVDMSTHYMQLGKVNALQRLEASVKSIKTTGRRLLPPNSKLLGLKDYLGNENVYLNTVFEKVRSIRNYQRPFDGSPASSPEGERGKVEVMDEIVRYIRRIKVS